MKPHQSSLVLLGTCSLSLIPGTLYASGFALIEQSASGLGTAFAGSAVAANDASVQFFNPAGLVDLDSAQISVAGHAIDFRSRFSDRASALPPAGLGLLPTGAREDDGGNLQGVPNLYLSLPATPRVALGLGVNAPFGLRTRYADPWIGRFQGIDTKLTTINVNPAVAYRITGSLSIGAGVDYQQADAVLTNAVMLGLATEGRARLDVSDHAWSWNAGLAFAAPGGMRVGLSYRARVTYDLHGETTVSTTSGIAVPAVSGPTRAPLTLPDSATLSVSFPLAERWTFYGDLSYTQWSRIKQIVASNPATGLPRDTLQFQFSDAWRYAFGAAYHASEHWTVRYGAAWDQSPVKDAYRTVRLPDDDRIWASVGAQWVPSDNWAIDAGYAHLFLNNARINQTRAQLGAPAAFSSIVAGEYDSSVDILSLQLTYRIK